MGQLSPCATTTDPVCSRARVLQQEKPPQWEARVLQLESSPHWPQLEKARAQQWRPGAAKNDKLHFKKQQDIDNYQLPIVPIQKFKASKHLKWSKLPVLFQARFFTYTPILPTVSPSCPLQFPVPPWWVQGIWTETKDKESRRVPPWLEESSWLHTPALHDRQICRAASSMSTFS